MVTHLHRIRLLLAAGFSVTILLAPSRAGATVPGDLCTGNPCVVSGAKAVDANADLDFGAGVDLVFAANAVVTTSGGGATFRAASITFQPGGRISAPNDQCHQLELIATAGDVDMQIAGSLASQIVGTQGGCPPSVLLRSPGNVNAGRMELHGHYGQYGFGGAVRIEAGGFVRTRGPLRLGSDGTMSGAGQIGIDAGTGISIEAPIYGVAGIEGLNLQLSTQDGDITTSARIDTSGGADGGGFITFDAPGGNVVIGGEYVGVSKASSTYTSCGSGAWFTIDTGGSVTIAAPMNLSSTGGTSCDGGNLFITAGTTVTQTKDGTIIAQGLGAFGSGGRLDINTGGDVTLQDVNLGRGGSLDATSSGGAIRVLGNVRANGGGLYACDVFVAAKGVFDMRTGSNFGSQGEASLTASESITVAGKVISLAGNFLTLREGTPLVTGLVLPAPVLATNPSLPDCRPGPSCAPGGSCGDGTVQCGEQCDDGAANGTIGSRCTATCTELPPVLRIPGGGSKPLDCPYEWSAELGAVVADGTGLPKIKQSCTDNDPACDFDPAVGRCGLRLWGCAGAADPRIACAATTVSSVVASAPKASSRFPFEVDARTALDAALAALVGGVGPGEVCTERFDVALAAGGRPLKLQVKAGFAGNKKDQDKLELRCLP